MHFKTLRLLLSLFKNYLICIVANYLYPKTYNNLVMVFNSFSLHSLKCRFIEYLQN